MLACICNLTVADGESREALAAEKGRLGESLGEGQHTDMRFSMFRFFFNLRVFIKE